MNFWNIDTEKKFFTEALKNFSSIEQLFYKIEDDYYTYSPKGKSTDGATLNGRNSLIGNYTEKWCRDFLEPIARELDLYCVNSVVCPIIGLTNSTDADIAFCRTPDKNQRPENIALIFEVKMSIVNNYNLNRNNFKLDFIGDYNSHKGNPSILRSDSMLKAIGKSINIRVSGPLSAKIPIVILGNTPISSSYIPKVDFLKKSGVVQSFISLYPEPTKSQYLECSPEKGFITFKNYSKLKTHLQEMMKSEMNFFSSMISKSSLGKIIRISSNEENDKMKAEKFLEMLRD